MFSIPQVSAVWLPAVFVAGFILGALVASLCAAAREG